MNIKNSCVGLVGDITTGAVLSTIFVGSSTLAALTLGVPVIAAFAIPAALAGTATIVSAVARNVINRLLDAFGVDAKAQVRIFLNLTTPVIGLAAGACVVAGLIAGGAIFIPSSLVLSTIALALSISVVAYIIFSSISLPCAIISTIGTEYLFCEAPLK